MGEYENEINRFDKEKLNEYKKVIPNLINGFFPYPRQVTFFPTYSCNHQCQGCLYGIPQRDWEGEISLERFQLIKKTFQKIGVERIEISGGGEPGCHPFFREILMELSAISLQTGIISNGSEFSEEVLKVVVQFADYIRISIDSLDENTYRKMHSQRSDLQIVLKNIERLKELKTTMNSGLVIGGKFLITRDNKDEIADIIRWSQNSGLDHIQFKSIRQAESELEEDVLRRMDESLQKMKFINDSETEIYGSLIPIINDIHCWTSPLNAVVGPFGDLYICCYFPGREDELLIGNILEEPFEGIWGSEKHKNLLSSINMSHCNHDCRFKMYNQLLHDNREENL